MMQKLTGIFSSDGYGMQIVLTIFLLCIVCGGAYWLFHLLFAHRLRYSGLVRNRIPRLGLVDIFSLDRQRQLIIVRRDNVEHLLMIGGPNDLVIESQIIRGTNPHNVAGNSREVPNSSVSTVPEPMIDPILRPTPPVVSALNDSILRTPSSPPDSPKGQEEPVVAAKAPILPKTDKPASLRPASSTARPHLPSPITPLRSKPSLETVFKSGNFGNSANSANDIKTSKIAEPAGGGAVSSATDRVEPAKQGTAFRDLESLESEMMRLLGREG